MSPNRRPIQSFVLRQGRMTVAQTRALERLEPVYGLAGDQPVDPSALFGRCAPLIVEIGFGNGESLALQATAAPDKDFIGIEVHKPGVGHLLLEIERRQLGNIRVYRGDAVDYLRHRLPEGSLHGINLFFPDPWHKKKHHKRRLVNPDFIALSATKLQSGGYIHLATDWQDYAEQMVSVLEACPSLLNTARSGSFIERPDQRPPTKFEQRGQRLGHGVWDILYSKV